MSAPVIWFGKFVKLLTSRGILTNSRNMLEFNGNRNYLSGQFQDFVVANDVVTGTGNRTTNTTKWRQSNASLVALETTNPLTPTQSLKVTLTGLDTAQFVESPLFTNDRADNNGKIFVQFQTEPSGTFAANDMDIAIVQYDSSGNFVAYTKLITKSGAASTGFSTINSAQISATRGIFQGWFTGGASTDQFSIIIRSNNASARTVVFGDFYVGAQHPIVTNNIIGRTDAFAGAIPAGFIGEQIVSQISTAVNAAGSNTFLALTSITLTPGVWSISAAALLERNGATLTVGDWWVGVATASASFTGTTVGYDLTSLAQGSLTTGGNISAGCISGKYVNISSSTTYYLNVAVSYSAGTPQWVGSLQGIRIA